MSAFTTLSLLAILFTIKCMANCGDDFGGISYDLSGLTLTSDDSMDYYQVSTEGWEYYFNICELVQSMPEPPTAECNITSEYCPSFDLSGDCPNPITKEPSLAYAFQYDKRYDECYRMSSDDTGQFTPALTYSLIDENDPAFGVAMQLNYGDYEEEYCSSYEEQGDQNRNLRIDFVCNSDMTNFTESLSNIIITEREETQEEACNAAFRIETSYACPAECGINSDGIVCNGQGSCGYDQRTEEAKCFCYAGYRGTNCSIYAGDDVRDIYFQDSKYDANIDYADNYTITIPTDFEYNVTYDLNFLVNGQGDRGFYTLYGEEYEYYQSADLIVFSLNKEDVIPMAYDVLDTPMCNSTTDGEGYGEISTFEYEFGGLMYRQAGKRCNEPNCTVSGLSAGCDILGRQFMGISLYDDLKPSRGFTLRYEYGDYINLQPDTIAENLTWSTEISFICDDNGAREEIEDLNDIFNAQGTFEIVSENGFADDLVRIEIYTSAGCPARCQTFNRDETAVQLCSGNGVCRDDPTIGGVRCICDDDDPLTNAYFCQQITEDPTMDPTMDPSANPTNDPTTTLNPTASPTTGDPTMSPSLDGTGDANIIGVVMNVMVGAIIANIIY